MPGQAQAALYTLFSTLPSSVFIQSNPVRGRFSVPLLPSQGADSESPAYREVQRILMELLAQMDGFDQTVNVKVIMATNR